MIAPDKVNEIWPALTAAMASTAKRARRAAWSSSVSPGKPTMKSLLKAMSGRMARSLRTVLLYSMAV